jgi:RNA polymerase sigma-70 factor (ECF subfamily)
MYEDVKWHGDARVASMGGFEKFEGREPLRAWLYHVAMSLHLERLRESDHRPVGRRPARASSFMLPEATSPGRPLWLDPCPDLLLDHLSKAAPGPESRYETHESVSLDFVAALQHLPPRQRATLVLRDVLGFPAAEAAEILECDQDAVTSDLQEARSVFTSYRRTSEHDRPPLPDSPRERALVARFVDGFERGDIDGVAALLTEEAWLTFPPLPFEHRGRAVAARVLSAMVFHDGTREFRLVATRANAQPAFGCYLRDAQAPIAHACGLIVLTLAGDQISALTHFLDNGILPHFDLPLKTR